MTLTPKIIAPGDLRVGLTAEYEREIAESDVLEFAENSGDFNPLHVDPGFAQHSRYAQRIVHGAFQVGLASALIGMHLPGRDVLLGSVNARFLSPLYFPSRVRVSGELTAWNAASRAGSVRVTVSDHASLAPASEITMAFTLQSEKVEHPAAPSATRVKGHAKTEADFSSERKIIILTGASGGIGAALLPVLAEEFSVLALVHRHSLNQTPPHSVELSADLGAPEFEQTIMDCVGARTLYGIIHCAWPGMPKGGLLQSDLRLIEQQLAFGTSHVVRLTRLLFNLVGSDGGRIVVLGSIAGHHKPALGLGAYSLAKSALEDTIRLLAPEIARKKISINAVCPTFVPAGMNLQADDLQIKREKALIPMGRICETEDIVGAIRYLLSPAASFISGQSIVLSGAQL
ncbi:MAG TPA: SDR family oxidoreductase [Terriglobales bacterium]|nr:SDR family oxidoreductase [Terriglobales bacterium]